MKRSYKLIGMLLSVINDAVDPPIEFEDCGNIGYFARFHKNSDGSPAGCEDFKFDGFDDQTIYDHYLAMLHGGLIFVHEWNDPNTFKPKHAIKLTTNGYDLLDEYKKWTT